MADIRIVDSQADSWAKESTLASLLKSSDNQQKLLLQIAKQKKLEDGDVDQLLTGIQAVVTTTSRGNQEQAKKEGSYLDRRLAQLRKEDQQSYERDRATQMFSRSVVDLQNNLTKFSKVGAGDVLGGAQNFISKLQAGASGSQKLGRMQGVVSEGLGVLNKVITGAAFAFGAYAGASKNFLSLVDTGLTFGGSLEKFQVSALRSGLGVEKFTSLMQKHSQAVSAVGEQDYARNIRVFRDTAEKFGYWGMTADQLAEAQGSYAEQMRLSGTIMNLNDEQRNKATSDYLTVQTAVSKLTGKRREELEKEAKAAKAEASVRIGIEKVRRTEGDEAATRLEKQLDLITMTSGKTAMQAAFLTYQGKPVTGEQARELAPTGELESVMDLGRALGGDMPTLVARLGQAAQVTRNLPDYLLDTLQTAATYGKGGGLAPAAQAFGAEGGRLEKARVMTPKKLQEMVDMIEKRTPVVNETMTGYLTTVNKTAEVTGDLAAAMWNAADKTNLFGMMMEKTSGVMKAAAGLSEKAFDFSGTAMGAPALIGGAIAASMLPNLIRGGTSLFGGGGGGGGGREFYGPPPPPGGGGLGSRVMGGLRAGGPMAIGGMLASGAGSLATGAGYTKTGAGLDVLGQAGTFAGTGALLGSIFGPPGTAVGAALGGAAGLTYGLYQNWGALTGGASGAGAIPASAPAGVGAGDPSQGYSAMLADISANTRATAELIKLGHDLNRQLFERLTRAVRGLGD